MKQIWNDMLTGHDRKCLANTASFQPRRGLGKRPAIIVIDMQRAVIGEDRPIYEQQDRYPYACGNFAWAAIRHIQPLLSYARAHGVPILYSKHCYRPEYGFAGRPANDVFAFDNPDCDIIPQLAPVVPGDTVVEKQGPSVFFATNVNNSLRSKGVDTVLLVGNTTSGCARATAIDATSLSFHTALIEECVFDRLEMAHRASMFDLQYKYCDVLPIREIYEYLENLEK
ncbi:MAG: isochorismatase family protein [Oscillibacter sp.]|nr:isochorismatase family protein [Oscillibacter sp.]